MELTGRIIAVLPLVSGTSARGEWKRQDYVIEHSLDQQYPRKMSFTVWGDNIDKFNIQMGQELTVSFDIDCREYQGRWFNDIRAWRVAAPQAPIMGQQPPVGAFGPGLNAAPTYNAPAAAPAAPAAPSAAAPMADSSSDLPF